MNNSVHKFYNSKGWLSDSNGNFFDAIAFEDLRKCSKKYLKNNRLRLIKYFPNQGDNLLDCASGPIQYPEYLEYSKRVEELLWNRKTSSVEQLLKISKYKMSNTDIVRLLALSFSRQF